MIFPFVVYATLLFAPKRASIVAYSACDLPELDSSPLILVVISSNLNLSSLSPDGVVQHLKSPGETFRLSLACCRDHGGHLRGVASPGADVAEGVMILLVLTRNGSAVGASIRRRVVRA
jgi:hypothetical protein